MYDSVSNKQRCNKVPQVKCCSCSGPLVLRWPYLDGSGQVGSLLAEVEQARDGHAIRQIVDEGHIIDQVVCLSNTQDEYGGNALWGIKARSNIKYILN